MREIFDRHQERMTGAEERRVREAMFAALDRRRPAWRRWAVPGAALAAAGAAVFAVALSLRGPADHIITDRFAQELAPGKEIETAPSAEPTLDATRERTMGAVDPPEPDAHPDDHPAAGAVGRDAAASAPEPDLGLSAEAKAEARRRAMEPRPVEGVTIVEQQRTVHTMAGEEREHLRVDRLPNAAPEGKKNEARERWRGRA